MVTAKKSPAKKAVSTKSAEKKATAKKTAAKKSAVKVSGVKAATKTALKRNAAKKSSVKKSSGRKYGPLAGQEVAEEMREMKRGELTMGRSGKKVTNPKQAIAIGLAKARREGGKVPPNPNTGH